jgi:hypothetical protein
MALNNSSILSYQLIPLIESIEPSKIFKLELPLYQTNPEFVFMMDVDNPFLVDGKFSVVLKESKTKGSLRAGSKTAGSRVLASSIKSSSKMALDAGITAKRSTLRASLTSLNAEKVCHSELTCK